MRDGFQIFLMWRFCALVKNAGNWNEADHFLRFTCASVRKTGAKSLSVVWNINCPKGNPKKKPLTRQNRCGSDKHRPSNHERDISVSCSVMQQRNKYNFKKITISLSPHCNNIHLFNKGRSRCTIDYFSRSGAMNERPAGRCELLSLGNRSLGHRLDLSCALSRKSGSGWFGTHRSYVNVMDFTF